MQDGILADLEKSLEVSPSLDKTEKLMMSWDDMLKLQSESYEIGWT